MDKVLSFLPLDRIKSISSGEKLPFTAEGAVLFADISGFSTMTTDLLQALGRRRGAEAATRVLNQVYESLLVHVHNHGGSVISFSGDGVLCWFPTSIDKSATVEVSLLTANAMIQELAVFPSLTIADHVTANLDIKVAIAFGRTYRMLVGDPEVQLIEVLAGGPVDAVGIAEQLANQGEIIVDAALVRYLSESWSVTDQRSSQGSSADFASVRIRSDKAQSLRSGFLNEGQDKATIDVDMARKWIHPAVYERLISSEDDYLAELRPCVALFCRFTGLDIDGDDNMSRKLDTYIRWVQHVVDRHGGALIQLTTGDKGSYFYAAFGAPVQYGDEARRASSAALELRWTPDDIPFHPQPQIGLARGRMRVGTYGSNIRRTYGVQGSAVNLAARIMMRAKPNAVLITEELATDTYDRFVLGPVFHVLVKGRSQPIALRELLNRTANRRSVRTPSTSEFYGRERELAILLGATSRIADGFGQTIRLSGPAGIGKSSLIRHALDSNQNDGIHIVSSSCQSSETSFAYYAFRPLFLRLLNMSSLDVVTVEDIWTALKDAVSYPDPAWKERLPVVGDILGLTLRNTAATSSLTAQLRRQVLSDLVMDIINCCANVRPLILTVEDIQWADEASLSLFGAVARICGTAPVLLIVDHRPLHDESTILDGLAPQERSLEVGPLDEVSVSNLLTSRLGAPSTQLLSELVYHHAQGNPFYTTELMDELQEEEVIRIVDGHWTLVNDMISKLQRANCLVSIDGEWRLADGSDIGAANLGVPDTVQATVLSRADRLRSDTRMTLRLASVIGRSFQRSTLLEAYPSPVDPSSLNDHLQMLSQRGFIARSADSQDYNFDFRHSITQEAIYDSLLSRQLHELHLAVAQSFEANLTDSQSADIEDIAYHYARADTNVPYVHEKAAIYLDRAADRAKREYVNETALSLYNGALTLDMRWEWLLAKAELLHILGHRREEQETLQALSTMTDADALSMAFAWADYHDATSEYGLALDDINLAMDHARRHHDVLNEARARMRAGAIHRRQGILDRAENNYGLAAELLDSGDSTTHDVADAVAGLGAVYRDQGKLVAAEESLNRALRLYESSGDRVQQALTIDLLGFVHMLRRRYDDSLSVHNQGLELSRQIGDRIGETRSLQSIAQALIGKGDYAEALRVLQRCLATQQRLADPFLEARTLNEIGIIHFMCGQYEEAIEFFGQCAAICLEIGDRRTYIFARFNLGQALRDGGRHADSEEALLDTLDLMRENEYRYYEAQTLSDLAMLYLVMSKTGPAIDTAQQSLDILNELDAPVSMTTDLATLAEVQRQELRLDVAVSFAERAVSILDECKGVGPDYPQRDYHLASLALSEAGRDDEADRLLRRAVELLVEQTKRISDYDIQQSYLYSVPHNRSLLRYLEQSGIDIQKQIERT